LDALEQAAGVLHVNEIEVSSDLSRLAGRELAVMNTSPVELGEIAQDPSVRELAREMSRWMNMGRSTQGSMFDRNVYSPPDTPYDIMRTCRRALTDDDIISGVADGTEAIAFGGGLRWESREPDDADVFNQLSADLNLDDVIRVMWRENFAVDQFVCAKLWGWNDYIVRGRTLKGNQRKKRYRVWAPQRLVILNSEHIVPTGVGPLREDRLAWNASPTDLYNYDLADRGDVIDPLMLQFFTGTYDPDDVEQTQLSRWGVMSSQLLAINPAWVFRHCHTRPDYSKFPDFRLKSTFHHLDLKRQLIASDRASLIGAANYILLIRKGNDAVPAQQQEIDNLKQQYNFLAKLPVIISDHRLEIDIIAPKLDFVLKSDSYDNLDHSILIRALSAFLPPKIRTLDAPTWHDLLAGGIQSRRHMIKRTLEAQLAKAVVTHPKNAGIFDSRPSLVFTPRNVQIGTDANMLSAMLTLRTQREVSRDTILEYLGLDEATEAQRLEYEEQVYDDIFRTQIPFASPGAGGSPQGNEDDQGGKQKDDPPTPNGTPEAPGNSGRRGGGRPVGGGEPKQSPGATAKPKSRNGNPSTKEN
jgi:hypothetical protein